MIVVKEIADLSHLPRLYKQRPAGV